MPYVLTTCAACAAPLTHDAPHCKRCETRYCNAACQHDHYEDVERVWLRRFGENHPEILGLRRELGEVREDRDRLQEESDKATMMAVALVAALAFLAGRRYLRR